MRYRGLAQDKVIEKVDNFLREDVIWGNVFNSICSKPLEIGLNTYMKGIETNLGDQRIFKGVSKVEPLVIDLLGNLFNAPDCRGNIVSGGTEANLLAIQAARKIRASIEIPQIIMAETVHFSFLKAIELMGLDYKLAKIDDQYRLIPASVKEQITDNTFAIIATAGTSEFGSIDPIEEIAQIAVEHNIYFHVDAATGGFIIPFARELGYKLPQFDFSIPGVSSMTVDPHKYGLVPIPAGCILFRDKSIQEHLLLDSYFVGTPSHTTLLGTRSGAPILATYAVLEHLGRQGFLEITKKNYQNTFLLINELDKRGYKLSMEPELNIVTFHVANAMKLLKELEKKGIIISVSKRFKDAVRIVINNHVTKQMIMDFIAALDQFVHNDTI